MRIMKGADSMWIALPDTINTKEKVSDILFADLGNDVYIAVLPINNNSLIEHDGFIPYKKSYYETKYIKYVWKFNPSKLNALVMEVGTATEHGSYINFKNEIISNTTIDSSLSDQIEYISTLGNSLKMEWVNTIKYEYMGNWCYLQEANPAGTLPNVWYNGIENDYNTWNNLEVVHGDKIVDSKWSDGWLAIRSDDNYIKIHVDTTDASVHYWKKLNYTGTKENRNTNQQYELIVYPVPASCFIRLSAKTSIDDHILLSLCDQYGRLIKEFGEHQVYKNRDNTITMDIKNIKPGCYILIIKTTNNIQTKKILIV
jgi:hypothetical protein